MLLVLLGLTLAAPLLAAAITAEPVGPTATLAPATRPATRPTTNLSPQRGEKAMAAFALADQKSPPAPGGIVFTGSSTITRWTTLQQDFAGLPVLNRGFGGSLMSDAVYFLDRTIVPYKPRTVVLYVGSNDLNAGRTPERVYADFKAFVAKLRSRLPEVCIVFMGIGPCPKRWAQADAQRKTNDLIRTYLATVPNSEFVDIWNEMLGPNGQPREDLFVPDRVHNSAEGYRIRTEILKAHLK